MREVEGIVLRVQEYKENDTLVTILVRNEGTITLYGRGMNKITSKLRASCLPYMVSQFIIEENDVKNILSLRSSSSIRSFRKIREDLIKQTIAMCMCDYALGTAENAANEIYDILYEALDILESSNDSLLCYAIYLHHICRIVGIEPFVDGCVICGSTTGICAVSANDGGFICANCNTCGLHSSRDYLFLFRVMAKADYSDICHISYTEENIIAVVEALIDWIKQYGYLVSRGNDLLLNVLHS